ncbi:endopeptidase La [Candidatus Portiera aleyrodidarum]|uniref:endopeptidase La n=1 Tax=Candidatus Portiera aleyrodidarum TaxID=91844 RepID=UPI000C779D23|nr:endopeptidase La [Candidatus Portiera aleyrodidarum]AUI72952.1 endopeptidase La [Candidatus Portiera aleyrodidarum]AUI73202.1 endopeptidase La [Candidatus Portiera aleyrodidarum]
MSNNQILPESIYLLPINNRPFFPAQIQPLLIDKNRWVETIKRVFNTKHGCLGLSYVGNNKIVEESPKIKEFPMMGTIVKIHRTDGDQIQLIAQGLRRFKIINWISNKAPFYVEVIYPKENINKESNETRAYAIAMIKGIKELLPNNPLYGEELKKYLNRFSPSDPGPLTDFAAAITSNKGKELQNILETLSILKRMQLVLPLLRKEIEISNLYNEISQKVNLQMHERQREFFLREQLKLIQKELDIKKDERKTDINTFKKRIKRYNLSTKAKNKINEEINKLKILDIGSPEYSTTRNYLEWLTKIPWGIVSKDIIDIKYARKILNNNHNGLIDIKERIIEFLAECTFKGTVGGSILLLLGPPGVGKTSIGKSIANALGRKFYRISLGGIRDEAEIKGHRRTYVSSMPGKIVQALKDTQVFNPVIMLDEIDKISQTYNNDPASALLEVLDSEQNNEFFDNYLDIKVDLSKVIFICTANQIDTIPIPLYDRMEVIRLCGYIYEEKYTIAKKYLWPRLLKKDNLPKKSIKITSPALKQVIEGYARESGVRTLEKQLHRIIRKSAVKLLLNKNKVIKISKNNLKNYLGLPKFKKEPSLKGIGVVTGLAWTQLGGVTLPIEAVKINNLKNGLKLTGNLGSVMKESAKIAYSYILANINHYKINKKFFNKYFIHLHVPEGAVQKDGPSAGITMTTALISLATLKSITRIIAMTGEITLTGKVLAVGGIREKIVAARRSEIFEILLPKGNKSDFENLPNYLKKNIKIHFVKDYKDVAKLVF